MKVYPLDANIAIQKAEVMFPHQLNTSSRIVRPPENYIPLVVLRFSLQEVIEKLISKEKGIAKGRLDAGVPIIITTNYVTQGDYYIDKSMYYIDFDFVVSDKLYQPPTIYFKSLSFAGRLESSDDAKKILQDEWNRLTVKAESN